MSDSGQVENDVSPTVWLLAELARWKPAVGDPRIHSDDHGVWLALQAEERHFDQLTAFDLSKSPPSVEWTRDAVDFTLTLGSGDEEEVPSAREADWSWNQMTPEEQDQQLRDYEDELGEAWWPTFSARHWYTVQASSPDGTATWRCLRARSGESFVEETTHRGSGDGKVTYSAPIWAADVPIALPGEGLQSVIGHFGGRCRHPMMSTRWPSERAHPQATDAIKIPLSMAAVLWRVMRTIEVETAGRVSDACVTGLIERSWEGPEVGIAAESSSWSQLEFLVSAKTPGGVASFSLKTGLPTQDDEFPRSSVDASTWMAEMAPFEDGCMVVEAHLGAREWMIGLVRYEAVETEHATLQGQRGES